MADPKLERSKAVWRKTHDGKPPVKGHLLKTCRVGFSGTQDCSVTGLWCRLLFTPAAGQRTSERMRTHLENLGFPIHERLDNDAKRRVEINSATQKPDQQQQQQQQQKQGTNKNCSPVNPHICFLSVH